MHGGGRREIILEKMKEQNTVRRQRSLFVGFSGCHSNEYEDGCLLGCCAV
jgi:hypothetical protein